MTPPEIDAAGPTLTLAESLTLPELGAATVLHEGDLSEPVRWISVIEWPVEDFVSAGDLVLTTGLGCDERQLEDLVREVAAAGAAGLCLSVGPGAIHDAVPASVVSSAAEHQLTLVELPWQLRFSDISRAIIQALYGRDYGSSPAAGALPAEFTRALLGKPGGIVGVAEALETVLATPVLVTDSSLAVIGGGSLGTGWSETETASETLLATLSELTETARASGFGGAVATAFEEGSSRVIVAAPAVVHDGVLGWVVTILESSTDHDQASIAVEHAATAVAIELLRRFTTEESESAAREDYLWELADGAITSPQEITSRATLLGLSTTTEYVVCVGLVDIPSSEDATSATASTRMLLRQIRNRLSHPSSLIAARGFELLLCLHPLDRSAPTFARATSPEPGVSWGVAAEPHDFAGLAEAAHEARIALDVTRALTGVGSIGRAERLGSSMLLHRTLDDDVAIRIVDDTLSPLENADDAKNSQMMHTLSVFLEENGNISSAARLLHLNRHSLIYRLHRIEELTGCSLSSHEDRLLLTMCVRIRALQG